MFPLTSLGREKVLKVTTVDNDLDHHAHRRHRVRAVRSRVGENATNRLASCRIGAEQGRQNRGDPLSGDGSLAAGHDKRKNDGLSSRKEMELRSELPVPHELPNCIRCCRGENVKPARKMRGAERTHRRQPTNDACDRMPESLKRGARHAARGIVQSSFLAKASMGQHRELCGETGSVWSVRAAIKRQRVCAPALKDDLVCAYSSTILRYCPRQSSSSSLRRPSLPPTHAVSVSKPSWPRRYNAAVSMLVALAEITCKTRVGKRMNVF